MFWNVNFDVAHLSVAVVSKWTERPCDLISIDCFLPSRKSFRTDHVRMTDLSQYMIFFGVSMAGIPWCYSAEILPLHVRAPGISIAVMFNWISVGL